MIYGWGISCEITIGWMSLALIGDKSTVLQIMAWYRQVYFIACMIDLRSFGINRNQYIINTYELVRRLCPYS